MSEQEQPKVERGIYRHGKTGGHYLVIGVVTDSTRQVHMVRYIPLNSPYREIVRDLEEFFEAVHGEYYTGPRFVFVPEAKF
jgi:hypothetical protein